jgi:hypothetical protein
MPALTATALLLADISLIANIRLASRLRRYPTILRQLHGWNGEELTGTAVVLADSAARRR